MLFVHTRALDCDLSPELVPMEAAALPTDGFFFASPPAQGASLTLAAPGLGDFPGQDFAPAWHWEDGSDLDRAGAAWYLVGRHAQVFDAVQRRGTGPVAFASFGFNSAAASVFVLPSFLVGSDEEGAWITVAYQAASVDEPRADRLYRAAIAWIKNFPHRQRQDALQAQPAAVVGKTSYQENVAAAVRAIRAGKAEKIVMARPARFEFAGEAGAARARAAGGALAARLRERYPTCWIFNVGGLVGATPEMLLEADAGQAHSRVLAGTATPGEDVDLAHSAKNLAEHQVALRSVAKPLRRVDPDLETSGPYLLQLPNLTHLATDLHLRVPAGKTLLHLVAQFHPTAAVCGLPREFARTFISRFEADRGRYAGPVGWVDAQGGGQLALALRCAQLDALGVEAWVGAGIMADSDPETEWRETGAKLAPIRDCLDLSAE